MYLFFCGYSVETWTLNGLKTERNYDVERTNGKSVIIIRTIKIVFRTHPYK